MGLKVTLACAACGSRNYSTDKNKSSSNRLEARKYCKQCGAHTLHRETK